MLCALVYRHIREAAGADNLQGMEEDFRWGIRNATSSEESSQDPTGQFGVFSQQSPTVTTSQTLLYPIDFHCLTPSNQVEISKLLAPP